jgi:ABC-type polysaccharide/polyol phosphate transport system ATPase subunit
VNPPVIQLDQVSLRYRLARQHLASIKEYAIHWMRGGVSYEDFWALTDVSLAVDRGQTVGIVGRNGAGKSSLLKIVTGILDPSAGTCQVSGTISPILELGAGFDIELTGLENISLNALLLGHPRRSIKARCKEIVEFAELGEFIDSPLRSYSSGMMARLGFAIATAWSSDVLVLDEVLAVGDAAFHRKCERRIADLRGAGTTVLLVSHSPREIESTCDRCLWIHRGRLLEDGAPAEVLAKYLAATV